MAFMEWQASLEVGLDKIDEDHRALVQAVNQLHAALDQGQDKQEIARVLNFLRDYTVTHFSTEEALMIKYNYPKAPAHFAAHAELLMKVSDFIADYRTGYIVSIPDMLTFLEAWLVDHIMVKDKDLGGYLKGQGVEA
jgi:hemerythrin-like metal-binding protein